MTPTANDATEDFLPDDEDQWSNAMSLILSIDVGTTNIKAALVDDFGQIVGEVKSLNMKIEGDATGCPPIFQYPINRLHYIATRNSVIRSQTAYVLDSKAFIMHELTGEYFTDYSTANSMGRLDIEGSWDRRIIEVSGFAVDQFPRVLNGFSDKVPLKDSICLAFGLKNYS